MIHVLHFLLGAGLVFVVLALWAIGRGWLGWVFGGALALTWWWTGGVFSQLVFFGVCGAFVLAALVTGLVPLRRALFGRTVLKAVGSILPRMSDTEREALDAGTVWWDADLFSGKPDWNKLLDFEIRELSAREREFLEGPARELCRMCDDHSIETEGDLPPDVWEYIKREGFMGMIIPEKYGGLGFSAHANSAVVTMVSSRCVTAAVTVMVPNSLGPAELLLHYGTEEQKDHYLPRLARGDDVPCFALTEPGAGSDAGAMTSSGVVCRGTYEGREVLGMRLNWNKRYITLSAISTVLGLAFKLYDPDKLLGEKSELGITCALIPVDTPGVETGERHDPLGVPFVNGPTRGRDVFVPIEFIIGGGEMAGKGWGMLMQSLAAGRGISLPALSAGASQLATRTVGAYATVREQFNLMIGRFEGIEAHLARIAGLTYIVDAARSLTVGAIDAGEKPSVVTAMVKAYSTESMRQVINDAMDVVGGAGICRGPRNLLASAYKSVPIGITVEGANILTRTMIVFGQGAIRCHPWVQPELQSAAARDVAGFDRAFFGHVNFVFTNLGRSFWHAVTGGALVSVPVGGHAGRYLKRLSRMSAAFALIADFAMGTLGGSLKRKENITGRLADALAWQYFASAAIKRFVDDKSPERDVPAMRWSVEHALHEIEQALVGVLENLPNRPAALLLRPIVFPFGARYKPPSDRLAAKLARSILEDGPARLALSSDIYEPESSQPGLGALEYALDKVMASAPIKDKLRTAQKARQIPRGMAAAVLEEAVAKQVISEAERQTLVESEAARDAAIQVDAFGEVREAAKV